MYFTTVAKLAARKSTNKRDQIIVHDCSFRLDISSVNRTVSDQNLCF